MRKGMWGIVLIFSVVLFLLVKPIRTDTLSSHPDPISGYEKSVTQIEKLRSLEPPEINPDCYPTLLTHGKKTFKAIVLIHGYTSCPKVYSQLAQEFYKRGYNVYMPRQPHHGFSDKMTEDLKNLKAEELTDFADQTIDIAQGLGTEVNVFGLSSGGVITSWIAQNRTDIKRAIIVSPSFEGLGATPFSRLTINAVTLAPNVFLWWDSKLKENIVRPPYAYPRHATHAIVQIYRLGYDVIEDAKNQKPRPARVLIVNNDYDTAVNNKVTLFLAHEWTQRGANVHVKSIDASYKLHHDLISPEQPYQNTKVAYPILLRFMGE